MVVSSSLGQEKQNRMSPTTSRRKKPSSDGIGVLTLENVRCFRSLKLPLDRRITVVLGENGSGKTTLVEALASLSSGDDEGLDAFPLRRGAKSGSISLRSTSGKLMARWQSSTEESRQRLPTDFYLFAYGRYRRLRSGPTRKDFDPESGRAVAAPPEPEPDLATNVAQLVYPRRTWTLSRPDDVLQRSLHRFLIYAHEMRSVDKRWDQMWKGLEKSLADVIDGLEVITRDNRLVPVILRRGKQDELNELSDGYQSILAIIFDLAFRYMYLFPLAANPLEGEAVVIIDEIDLHLHPRWQRRVVQQLALMFPGTRFLVTTHSPAAVQNAIDEDYQVVVLRDTAAGVTPHVLTERELRGLEHATVGSILVDDALFNVPSRFSPEVEAMEEKVRALRQQEESGEASNQDRKELLRLLEKLRLYQATEEERRGEAPFLSEIARVRIAFLKDLSRQTRKKHDPSSTKRHSRSRKVGSKRRG